MKRFFEIFRAGNYPQGSYSAEDVQAIADNYDSSYLEAPITLDHDWGGPAYGWIEELKAEGKRLLASFKDVSDELTAMVSNKRYKTHSVEIYNDIDGHGPYLKALAMLGASSPQVKGMAPIEFSEFSENFPDNETATVDFDAPLDAEAEVEDKAEVETETEPETFTEEEMNERLATFEQRIQNLTDELESQKQTSTEFKTENERIKFDQRRSEFTSFLDEKVEAGKLLPKLKGKATAMFSHLDGLEAGAEDEKAPLALFKEIIDGLVALDLDEQAPKNAHSKTDSTPPEIAKKARAYAEAQDETGHPVSFTDAVNHVKNNQNNQ